MSCYNEQTILGFYLKGVPMQKSFPNLLPSLIFAILLFLIPGWNEVNAYSTDAETQSVILYVKPGANGSCTSWEDACELQTALFNAVAGDQIWVSAGTYKPTTTTNCEATFQLKSGVAIYGGFPATGGEMVERDWEAYNATLSGDIGISGDNADNSYHVVTGSWVDATAILDGFTITAGNANGVFPDNYGGGMLIDSGSPTLSNLVYSSNSALFGGGLSNIYSSNPVMTQVTFVGNSASEYGGGMYNKYSSSPSLTNLTFVNNSAKYGGGLANNDNSSPTLSESHFAENSADVSGGGIWNYNNSNLTLTDVIFSRNSALNGGGIWNEESVLTLMQASFESNSAMQGGGGIKFHLCGNDSILQNVTFSNNSADSRGGGLLNHYSSPRLVNVTFTENFSNFDGGGIFNEYHSHPTMTNSILWENTPDQIVNDSNSSMLVTYSIIQRGYIGEGNLDLNPLLGNLQNNGGFSETHALPTESPAVDAGNPDLSTCPETDQRTLPRPIDGNGDSLSRCDMGAYETQPHILVIEIVGNGEVEVVPDQPDYALSQQVTLIPTADPGWTFAGWSRDASGSDNPLTITIQGDTNITATFTQDEYSLTVTPIGFGTVEVDPAQATYHYGDVVALTPNADNGWTFTGWTGDVISTNNPLTVIIQGNTNITAIFTQDEYTLTVLVNPTGSGTVSRNPDYSTYHYGDVVTLTPTADLGRTFTRWTGDVTSTNNPLTITIQRNTNITATFTQDEYTLTVIPVGSGTVSVDPVKATYHYGDVLTFTPTANPGWTFDGWGADASGSDNPLSYTIIDNTSITATFTQDEYTLTVTPTGSGTVAVEPLQATYHYGDVVTLTPTANPGWTFFQWGGDASGSENPLSYTIIGDTSITATFTQNDYTLIVSSIGSGTVPVDPVQATYHYGDVVTLTPTADPGWTFTGWSGDATGSDNPLTYTIVGNTNITATFTQDEYTLTITPIDSGTVAVDPVQATYYYGDIITLIPTADPGWTFFEWGGDASGSDNPLTITIQGNTTITATFTQDEYSLTVTLTGFGMVTVDPVQATYQYGDAVTLTPTADTGWTFTGWSGDATGSDNPLSYTIVGNTSITGTFTQDEYSLTVTPIGSGMVTVDPDQLTYHYGDVVTLTPTADPGWIFDSWGGDASGSDNPLTYTIIEDTSITATFTQNEYTLAIDIVPAGSGTVIISPMQTTYHYGDEVTLTPGANPGWTFSEWSGEASGSENPLTVIILGDTNITANFTQDQYTLDVTIEGFGSVAIEPIQATYSYGTKVTLTATANPSWNFAGWGGDASGLDNPLIFTIQKNTGITAVFTTNWIFLPMITR